ncbi:Ubiquitin-conjugating enzyme E2 S [Operophtera brumata]|uniref:Ubiquitin-conjugating enzyme E2 S n=1 Tax=Operophtera brumata TaxID=104452 RepID=A0A0L7LP19_OPEBR|nr:Ubiquitin-conjugating enzyme E2 S [Operophtera brumata]
MKYDFYTFMHGLCLASRHRAVTAPQQGLVRTGHGCDAFVVIVDFVLDSSEQCVMSNVENVCPQTLRSVARELSQLAARPPAGIKLQPRDDELTDVLALIDGPGECALYITHPQTLRSVARELSQLAARPPAGIKLQPRDDGLTDVLTLIDGPGEYALHITHPRTLRSVVRELSQLAARPPAGIKLQPRDDELTDVLTLIDGPADTPYAGGVFRVRLALGRDFPSAPPRAFFLTRLFHPNVSAESGEVCVDTLQREWRPERRARLAHALLALRCLLSGSAARTPRTRLVTPGTSAASSSGYERLRCLLPARPPSHRHPRAAAPRAGRAAHAPRDGYERPRPKSNNIDCTRSMTDDFIY